MRIKPVIATALALLPALACAAETVAYSYDAKGRLTKVEHTGGRNNGQTSTYSFDAADNRTQSQVTGARGNLVIVPLGRLRLIHVR